MQYHINGTCSGDDCDDDDITVDNHYNHGNGTIIEASGMWISGGILPDRMKQDASGNIHIVF